MTNVVPEWRPDIVVGGVGMIIKWGKLFKDHRPVLMDRSGHAYMLWPEDKESGLWSVERGAHASTGDFLGYVVVLGRVVEPHDPGYTGRLP